MAWILDLSTDPPDIYTDNTVQGNVHNSLESPYPKTMWYIAENPNDIKTAATKDYHTPCFDFPYPASMWYISTNPNDVKTAVTKEYEEMGAFYKAFTLQEIVIPESVKSIGAYSFAETALTEVTLADDCTYYSTSFPPDCEITGGQIIT